MNDDKKAQPGDRNDYYAVALALEKQLAQTEAERDHAAQATMESQATVDRLRAELAKSEAEVERLTSALATEREQRNAISTAAKALLDAVESDGRVKRVTTTTNAKR